MKRITLVLSCIINCYQMIAQTPLEDLMRMNKLYSEAKSYSSQVEVKLFKAANDSKPWTMYSGNVMRLERNMKSSLMSRISLVNDKYVLLIDNRLHLILFRSIRKDEELPPMTLSDLKFDSLLKAQGILLRYVSNTATETKIEVLDPAGTYKKIEISLDPVTNTMKQIVYFLSDVAIKEGQAAKMIVNYKNVQLNPVIDPGTFSEKPFIRAKGSSVVPQGEYQHYELINQDKNKID